MVRFERSSGDPMDNRRKFARVAHELLSNYSHYDMRLVKDDEGMAKTLNMSVRGLLLQLPRAAEPGTTLQLTLALGEEIVDVVGQVVRCRLDTDKDGMFDVGIELTYVPDRFAKSVERYFAED